VPLFDLVVFLSTPEEIRLQRLADRELARFGAARLGPGGDMSDQHREFLAWARAYEGGTEGRSRQRHEAWLEALPDSCKVLRLNGTAPVFELVRAVAEATPPGR
jgi:hypothetical protein